MDITVDIIMAIIIGSFTGLYIILHIIGWLIHPERPPIFNFKPKINIPPPIKPPPPPPPKKKIKPKDLDFLNEFPEF